MVLHSSSWKVGVSAANMVWRRFSLLRYDVAFLQWPRKSTSVPIVSETSKISYTEVGIERVLHILRQARCCVIPFTICPTVALVSIRESWGRLE